MINIAPEINNHLRSINQFRSEGGQKEVGKRSERGQKEDRQRSERGQKSAAVYSF